MPSTDIEHVNHLDRSRKHPPKHPCERYRPDYKKALKAYLTQYEIVQLTREQLETAIEIFSNESKRGASASELKEAKERVYKTFDELNKELKLKEQRALEYRIQAGIIKACYAGKQQQA